MSKRWLLAAILSFATLPLRAGFDEVVSAIEQREHLQRVSIPFLGLARVAVWCAHPRGVHDFQLATFEDRGHTAEDPELGAIVKRSAGFGFQPLVEVHSRRNGEWTYIFARPQESGNVELMIATRDKTDTTVIRVVLDADRMLAQIDEPRRAGNLARR